MNGTGTPHSGHRKDPSRSGRAQVGVLGRRSAQTTPALNQLQVLASRFVARIPLVLVIAMFAVAPLLSQSSESLPDWSGAWQMNGDTIFDRATMEGEGRANAPGVREHPPYTAEWEAKYERNLDLRDRNLFADPLTRCGIPAGFPRIMNLPDAYEFAVTPEKVWIIAENGPNLMRIYTDGRDHPAPEDMWPTYTGDSVGHWEGDTLVFDTVSLLGSEDGNTILDRTGLWLSEAAHTVTRLRKLDEETMEAQMTIEDPNALEAAWVVTKTYRKLPEGTRVYDYACNENNRNPVDPGSGRTLTLGPDGEVLDTDYQR